jgi:hypothetical protein
MKNCIYCNQLINDEDVFCRSCGKKQNSSNENELTLDDLNNLNEKWTQSYLRFPPKTTDNIMGFIRKFMMDDMSKVFAEYFRHEMIDDIEYQKILMQITGLSLQWALLCFEIGIEGGLKRIEDEDVPKYCIKISKPYRDALAIWVIRLLIERKIRAEQANSFIEMINNSIIKLAVTISNLGFIRCKQVEPKGNRMEFYNAIKQIPIDT